MKLEQLKYILALEEYGSISKAAANLFVSQPNLSKSIVKLKKNWICKFSNEQIKVFFQPMMEYD